MSLVDVMSAAGLHAFAEVGMTLFMAAFVVVVVTTFWRRNREAFERARYLPLRDDDRSADPGESGRDG